MSRIQRRNESIKLLIGNFGRFLDLYDKHPPFSRYGQLEFHLDTIGKRRKLGSVKAAISDSAFLSSLYETLKAWGIGTRASRLSPPEVFEASLRNCGAAIEALDELTINDANVSEVSDEVWQLLTKLEIVDNEAKLVSGSKALHHLLPELVVPIDRAYTQRFFGWQNPVFQYRQRQCFREAFSAFAEIARSVSPEKFVGTGWRSSRTKIIDNALIGMLY